MSKNKENPCVICETPLGKVDQPISLKAARGIKESGRDIVGLQTAVATMIGLVCPRCVDVHHKAWHQARGQASMEVAFLGRIKQKNFSPRVRKVMPKHLESLRNTFGERLEGLLGKES